MNTKVVQEAFLRFCAVSELPVYYMVVIIARGFLSKWRTS